MALRGVPRRRGRPAKVPRMTRGSHLRGSHRRVIGVIGQKDGLDLGDEAARWQELKEDQELGNDEELAKFLMDSWETRSVKKENKIQVGPATVRDFKNFQTKVKRSSDEIIRFFLRLEIDPGQSVVVVEDDVTKRFESLKSALKLNSNDLMKYLFILHEKYMKEKSMVRSDIPAKSEVAMEKTVRRAVREELLLLCQEGALPWRGSSIMSGTEVEDGGKPATNHAAEQIDSSPDSTKKRSRKSQPQRVVIEQSPELSDSDIEDNLPLSVAFVKNGLTTNLEGSQNKEDKIEPIVLEADEPEVIQYNYVISNSIPCSAPSDSTPQSGEVSTISVYNTPTKQELEAQGIFQVGQFTVQKDAASGLLTCPYCEYKSQIIARLRRHVTLHTGKAYKCTMCDKSYTEEYKLKEHFQVKHERSVHFKCELCERDFTSKGGLKYHTKTVHRKDFSFWCEQCCKGFNQLLFYQRHMNRHNGPLPYKCNVCMKEFAYLATLTMHKKSCTAQSTDDNSFMCEMCGDTYTNSRDLEEHITTEHCDVSRYRCACGKEFRWRTGFENHKAECKFDFFDPGLQKEKVSPKDEADGLTNVAIINVESLYNPPKQDQFNDTDGDKGTNVNFDDNSLDSIKITNVESGEQFVCDLTAEDPAPKTPDGTHTCNYCDYKTQKISHLRRHTLTHTGKKHRCLECPKSFTDLTKLRSHQTCKHQGKARYKCDKCSRTFSSKGGIMYHQQTKHNNSYKYRCETCEKGFNTIQHYLGHKNTHSGVRPYVCDKCGLGFAYPSVLTSHKRVCKGKIEGMNMNGHLDLYPCKECNEKFAMYTALQEHMRDIHAKNSYRCECGADFELRALYDLHKTTCNKNQGVQIVLETMGDNSVESVKLIENPVETMAEFRQISQEKFNAIVNNQPVFPS